MPTDQIRPLRNFCNRSGDDVGKLFSGPNESFICDCCVIQALEIICQEKRGVSFRIAYFVFQSILKVGYAFEWLVHSGKIPN
jgi:hypothetical protein